MLRTQCCSFNDNFKTRPGDLVIRVSQEFFQTMATPEFSAFGYLKMEFIEEEKNKLIKFEVTFFLAFSK